MNSGRAGSPAGMLETEAEVITVGVLSDTHGRLHPRVKESLKGVAHIIHAGDVGSAQVLTELKALASLTAVRGNCDHEAWASVLPSRAELELGGVRILVGHAVAQLRGQVSNNTQTDGKPGFAVVVTGHTHLAAAEERDGMLYLNPGSAGPRRLGRPRTMARLTIRPAQGVTGFSAQPQVSAQIVVVPD